MASTKQKWAHTKRRWRVLNPPNEQGYYICVFCTHPIEPDKLSLDHIQRVADSPHLRYALWNLQPMHQKCNSKRDRLMTQPNYVARHLSPKNKDPFKKRVEFILGQVQDTYATTMVTDLASSDPKAKKSPSNPPKEARHAK